MFSKWLTVINMMQDEVTEWQQLSRLKMNMEHCIVRNKYSALFRFLFRTLFRFPCELKLIPSAGMERICCCWVCVGCCPAICVCAAGWFPYGRPSAAYARCIELGSMCVPLLMVGAAGWLVPTGPSEACMPVVGELSIAANRRNHIFLIKSNYFYSYIRKVFTERFCYI